MIQKKKVDLGAPSLVFAKSRINFVDSGLSVFKLRLFLLFRHPKYATTTQKNLFLMPLEEKVWWSIFVVSLVTIIVLMVLYLAEKRKDSNKKNINNPFVISIIINVIALLAQQGLSYHNLKSFKSKIVIISFLFLSYICFQFYSASIVGSLLVPPIRSITSLKRLTDSNLKIVLEDHPGSHTIFAVSPDSDVAVLYEKKVKGKETFLTTTDGIKLVKQGKHAFLTYVDDISEIIKSTLTHSEVDELQEIPLFHQDHRALLYTLLQKRSPFSEAIRVGNLYLAEVGLQSYHMGKWTSKLTRDFTNSFNFADIDFKRTSSIFYMLCIGYLTSFMVLLGEFIVAKSISLEHFKDC